jgi:hypothetical protein
MLGQQFSAAAQHPKLLDIHKGTDPCLDIQVWMVPKKLLFDISGSKIQTRAYTVTSICVGKSSILEEFTGRNYTRT